MSLHDTVRKFQEAMPHAKVVHAAQLAPGEGPARQRLQRGDPKVADARKRSLDAETGDNVSWTRVAATKTGRGREVTELTPVPKLTDDGRRLRPFVFTDRYGERKEVRWCDPRCPPKAIHSKHDKEVVLDRVPGTPEKHGLERGPYPMHMAKYDRSGKWGKFRKGMTITKPNEILNENIGGIMGSHAAPEITEHFRQNGTLQVRPDQNGNPCEYAVFSSRKDMERKVREFNERVRDNPKFREGHKHYIRHGGMD